MISIFNRKATLVEDQIRVFLAWVARSGAHYDAQYLECAAGLVDDILDFTDEDEVAYIEMVRQNHSDSEHAEHSARRAINSIRKFYMARTKNVGTGMPVGRPPKVDQIEKARKYREAGLSIREVARALKSDISLVHKWLNYDDRKLRLFKK